MLVKPHGTRFYAISMGLLVHAQPTLQANLSLDKVTVCLIIQHVALTCSWFSSEEGRCSSVHFNFIPCWLPSEGTYWFGPSNGRYSVSLALYLVLFAKSSNILERRSSSLLNRLSASHGLTKVYQVILACLLQHHTYSIPQRLS